MHATEWRASRLALLLAGATWTAGGCAATNAPRGFLPNPTEAQSDTYGAWADVTVRRDDGRSERIQGELIAMTTDSTWILTDRGGEVFPTEALVEGRLTEYDSRAGDVSGAAVAGVVSTISNGAFLIFTAPMWIIGGTAAASSQSRLPNESLAAESPESLSRYARFPRGMPTGVTLSELEPKPSER